MYSQEVQPTAPTRTDFSRPFKYDPYPCRLQSTAGKELQTEGRGFESFRPCHAFWPFLYSESPLFGRAGGATPRIRTASCIANKTPNRLTSDRFAGGADPAG